MLYKEKLIILLLSTLFSNVALSADCDKVFHKLDKQPTTIADKDHSKKFIQRENELFDAINLCKTYAGMFVLMGELQIEVGQIPLAVIYGRKSVEIDAKYWRAHKLLGSAQMLNNEHERGLKSLKKAVDMNPENVNTQLNFISALIQHKKYDQALTLINAIIHKKEKEPVGIAYYFRSQVYKGKGLIAEADQDVRTAQGMGFAFEQK